jgi:hypothetical protein
MARGRREQRLDGRTLEVARALEAKHPGRVGVQHIP